MRGWGWDCGRAVSVSVMIGALLVLAPVARADLVVGNISIDTTWDRAGNPWTVATDVTVRQGATLEIEAGAIVEFTGNWQLQAEGLTGGAIVVQGAPYDSVYFRPQSGVSEWKGIYVSGSSGSSFDYAVVLAAKRGVDLNASDAPITHCAFRRCETGVWCAKSSPAITSCWVSESSLAGILCYAGSITVDVSQPVILDCNLFDNTGPDVYNVYLLGYPGPGVVNINAQNNWWGTFVDSEIQASIFDGHDSGGTGFVDYANPLEQTAVEHRTWGGIKALFRD